MLKEHAPLVTYFARRWASALPSGLDVDDLEQVGRLALLEALGRFDPKRGGKFRTYAAWRVKGAMGDEIRRMRWNSRHNGIEQLGKLIDARRAQSLPITTEALAEATGQSVDRIRDWEARIDQARLSHRTLDEVGVDGELTLQIADTRINAETRLLERERLRLLHAAVDQLPPRMRTVITLHYFEELTNAKIGELLQLTESRISQMISEAKKMLKEALQIVDLDTAVPFSVVNPLPVGMCACVNVNCPILFVCCKGYARKFCSRRCSRIWKAKREKENPEGRSCGSEL